jgi:GNAT superfamily N-acetyltransferase
MSGKVEYRAGDENDSYQAFEIFEHTLADLNARLGSGEATSVSDPSQLARMWEERRSLYDHLARTADQFWLAERDGRSVGFARAIRREGMRQLTEFFVLPGEQSKGVGRELLRRAFPRQGDEPRSIIATADLRAQARYLKSGLYPRFPIYYLSHEPGAIEVDTDLEFAPLTGETEILPSLAEIDRQVLGFGRDIDHRWLMADREGVLCTRGRQPVGYGYFGRRNGPFAMQQPEDYPAVLAYAERMAVQEGRQEFGLEVPMINRTAVDFLMQRGFHIGELITFWMCDRPFGDFERYIFTSPPFIV